MHQPSSSTSGIRRAVLDNAVRLTGLGAIALLAMLPNSFAADPQASTHAAAHTPRLQASLNRGVSPTTQAATPAASAPKEGADTSLPPEVGQDWWSAVQKNLAAAEYNVTRRGGDEATGEAGAYQAPNRAQGFHTTFDAAGIRIAPRSEEQKSWQWGLELSGYGWSGDIQPVAKAEPRADENRVEYARAGLVEWYVNDPRGLEQGFTLERPASASGAAETSRIVVELALRGGLAAYPSEDGQSIEFSSGKERVLRYAELRVTDAKERVLPARMEIGSAMASGPVVRIVVEAAEAAWPIIVDPLATSPSWTATAGQANANFGYSVASAGDVNGDGYGDVIIGAKEFDNVESDEGRAYVYYGSASGLAASPAWTAESDQNWAAFGCSVASAGDVNGDGYADVIVGASEFDNVQGNEGWAFVYHGSASGLSTTAAWTAESNQANAYFGSSVASAGDVNGDGYADVVVGAYYFDSGESQEGVAFVWHGSANGLNLGVNGTPLNAAWTVESNQADARFGRSVASAGDVNGDGYADVIVGAAGYDNDQINEGRALVYHGSPSGLLTTAAWTAEGNQASGSFGWSVASAGDVNGDGYADVIIGHSNYDGAIGNEGRACVYLGTVFGLMASASWDVTTGQSAVLGHSVASAGDVNGDGYADVIVGAPWYINGESDEGQAYLYYGSRVGLSTTAAWIGEGNDDLAYFGWSVASAGDVNGDGYSDVIVGAPNYDNVETQEGVAFVYYGAGAGLGVTANWTVERDQSGAYFGGSVASAGDVNGDGYADVIVGACAYDNGETDEGRVYLYHGSASGLSTVASWTAEGNEVNARFGYSVASAGDVNGDGYADVIVGANEYDNGESDEGRAYVYHGSASGLSTAAAWTAESNLALASFGYSVASAGDVNGDGYADVIIGANEYDNGESDEGRAYVYHGSASGLSTAAAWTAEGNQENAYLGWSVASAGDVNGDGYADVIIGARYYSNGESIEGRAYVYHGSASGLSTTTVWTAESNQALTFFGYSVASAGDVNGDGYADVIVGAVCYSNGEDSEGRAYVYHGSASGLSTAAAWTAESNQVLAFFGYSVASAGDVNGDGYSDVIIGANEYDNVEAAVGRAYVFHGSATGLSGTAAWIAEGDQAGAQLGYSVASAGDVNGDGYADIVVGARYEDPFTEIAEGRAHAYYGNAGSGRAVLAQQLRGNGSSVIAQPWGSSGDPDEFQVRAWHSSPFGRESVKTEIERCPSGVPFGGAGCLGLTSAWTDSTASTGGVSLTETLSGLIADTLYHWRERTLRAPYSVTQAGITPPPHPAHGPWRRFLGQAVEADIRTGSSYSLTVAKGGSGSGTVTSDPTGISCGATCSASFAYNTVVSLSQVAAAGSVFTGWSGACSGTGPCSVTMSTARAVIATFQLAYTLTIAKTGAGTGTVTSSPAGIACGATCAYGFAAGTAVTLSAVADATASFAGWSGEGCSGIGTCQVTMSAARSVQAQFIVKTATGFVPVTPCRLIDTRLDSGPSAGAPILAPSSRRVFSLLGKCGLASGAKAISANLTVVSATVQGDLQVIAGHLTSTNTSSLSIPISRARANNAIVQLSVDSLQTIAVINPTTGSVHFILDINGYFL
jgi:hypothetical protein